MTVRWKTVTSLSCAMLAVLVGVGSYVIQEDIRRQEGQDSFHAQVVKACTSIDYRSMEEFVQQTGLISYDRTVGWIVADPWVCTATQQWYHWMTTTTTTSTTTTNSSINNTNTSSSSQQAGLLLMAMKTSLELPILAITIVEAGRHGTQGILQYPTLLSILYFCFGASIIFPTLWVSSYILWGSHNYQNNDANTTTGMSRRVGVASSVSPLRSALACLLSLPPALLFLCNTLFLTPNTTLWRACVGLFGGSPLLALLPLLAWKVPPCPQLVVMASSKQAVNSAKTVAAAYTILGGVALLGWILLVLARFVDGNNNNIGQLASDIGSTPALQLLAVEIVALYGAWMIHIASRSGLSALEALLMTPLVGPGAAVAMELVTLEVEQFTIPKRKKP